MLILESGVPGESGIGEGNSNFEFLFVANTAVYENQLPVSCLLSSPRWCLDWRGGMDEHNHCIMHSMSHYESQLPFCSSLPKPCPKCG